MIAPRNKVIVRIPKSDDRLAQSAEEVSQGILVAAGEDVSAKIVEAALECNAVAFFGKNKAELPGDKHNNYLVMEEFNLYAVYPKGK